MSAGQRERTPSTSCLSSMVRPAVRLGKAASYARTADSLTDPKGGRSAALRTATCGAWPSGETTMAFDGLGGRRESSRRAGSCVVSVSGASMA